MLPNFQDKEMLLTDKISYRLHEPKRGDVVVFRAPPSEACAENECEYIKRVIGLPGEKIMVKSHHVYIDGEMLVENYLPPENVTEPGNYLTEGKEAIIPGGYYVLMGDNRSHSRDSREFGSIEERAIVGRAFFIYWPLPKLGLTTEVAYP